MRPEWRLNYHLLSKIQPCNMSPGALLKISWKRNAIFRCKLKRIFESNFPPKNWKLQSGHGAATIEYFRDFRVSLTARCGQRSLPADDACPRQWAAGGWADSRAAEACQCGQSAGESPAATHTLSHTLWVAIQPISSESGWQKIAKK